jgi:hypothetical protein
MVTAEQRATSNQQRATSNQQRATSNQQRATSNQQPATSNQQRATSNQQRATSNQQRATSNQQPATSNQQPATSKKVGTRRFLSSAYPAAHPPRQRTAHYVGHGFPLSRMLRQGGGVCRTQEARRLRNMLSLWLR